MASTSTTIVINATDNTRAAIDSATKGIKSLSDTIKGIPGFSGIAGSLAAFASAGAIKSLIGDTISWASEMKTLSEKTGTSVESLSTLAKVAKISGTEFGAVEQAIVRFQKSLAGADEESRGAGNALSALGLNIESIKALDPAAQFKEIADALSQYADDGSKVAIVQDLIGKNGAQLLPMFKDLAEQKKMQASLTSQQATAAQELEQAWRKVNNEGGAWAKQLALELIPTLASLMDFLNLTKMGIYQVGSSIAVVANDIRTFAQVAAVAIGAGFTEEGQSKIGSLLDQRKNFVEAANEEAVGRLSKYTSLRDRIDKTLTGSGKDDRQSLNYRSRPQKEDALKSGGRGLSSIASGDDGARLVAQLQDQIRGMQELTTLEKLEAEILDGKYKTATAANLEIARGYAQTIDNMKAMKSAAEEEAKIAREGVELTERMATPIEAAANEMSRLNSLLSAGVISIETFERASEKISQNLQATQVQKMQQAVQAAGAVMEAMVDSRMNSGYYTTMEAMRAEGKMNAEKIAQLQELKAAYAAMGEAGAASVAQIDAQIMQLSAHLDPLADAIRKVFEDAFTNFFDDVLKVLEGTKTLKDAFKDLGKSILKDLWHMASKELSQQIMKLLGNGLVPGEGAGLFSALSQFFVPDSRGIGNDVVSTGREVFNRLKGGGTIGAGAAVTDVSGLAEQLSTLDSSLSALVGTVSSTGGTLAGLGTAFSTMTATTAITDSVMAGTNISTALTEISMTETAAAATAAAAGLSSVAAASTAEAAGGLIDIFSAKGNVFDSPGLSAFSGTIVNRPTLFPFAAGMGLMGEAGPEAILPLARGPNGKLGIQGGRNGHAITIYQTFHGSASAADVRRSGGALARDLIGAVNRAERYR